mmetsp:Transcript_118765/g.378778  ORF Transcript_118765/g.378778 Transcript_118765/m.378778 type:complete len:207 (-) Transcript_118765:853-1473(-)
MSVARCGVRRPGPRQRPSGGAARRSRRTSPRARRWTSSCCRPSGAWAMQLPGVKLLSSGLWSGWRTRLRRRPPTAPLPAQPSPARCCGAWAATRGWRPPVGTMAASMRLWWQSPSIATLRTRTCAAAFASLARHGFSWISMSVARRRSRTIGCSSPGTRPRRTLSARNTAGSAARAPGPPSRWRATPCGTDSTPTVVTRGGATSSR